MSQHKVKFTVPERPVGNADIIFTVYADQEKFGELRLSKGNIVWYPANKVYGYTLTWTKLDDLAREHGRQG
jgi:hypothetical protein